jgi:hypothetical protein
VVGRSPLTTDAGLRAFAAEALGLQADDETSAPLLLQVDVARTVVTQWEGGAVGRERPLLVEAPLGMGRVSIITLDLSKSPLSHWPGRSRMLARAVGGEGGVAERRDRAVGGRMAHVGYTDLSGQLRSALDQYPGVAPMHFYAIAGVLLVYVALLGPGEYFLLKKAAPLAMHFTWVIFPLLIVLFSTGAILLGGAARGTGRQANVVEVLDIDAAGGRHRGAYWMGFYSPEADAADLSMLPRIALPDATLDRTFFAWQPLPGRGLGGVDADLLLPARSEPYALRTGIHEAPARLERLRMPPATSKLLGGSWSGQFAPDVDASALRRGRIRDLEGSFRNVSPVPLQNAWLAHGDYIYRLRSELAPGAIVNVERLDRKHVEYQLTQREVLDLAAPWNQEETDVSRILEVMMFHEALRGRNYTVLTHRYQPELDLSFHIKRGYAVLVGRAETPVVDLESHGQPLSETGVRRWTWYRILYPVMPAAEAVPMAE